MATRIGVLALQGDVEEHEAAFKRLGAETRRIRKPGDAEGLDGLVIPGGESTTIGLLLKRTGLLGKIRGMAKRTAIYGTCAGLILLAKRVEGEKPWLGLLDVSVKRNAYGRQTESFEAGIKSSISEKPLKAAFIRAPAIVRAGKGVEVLAQHRGMPVLVRQENILASSFHPEISGELAVHRHFLSMASGSKKGK